MFLFVSVFFEFLGKLSGWITWTNTWVHNIYPAFEFGAIGFIYVSAMKDGILKRYFSFALWISFFVLLHYGVQIIPEHTVSLEELNNCRNEKTGCFENIKRFYEIPVIQSLFSFVIVMVYLFRQSGKPFPMLKKPLVIFSLGLLPYLIFTGPHALNFAYSFDDGNSIYNRLLRNARLVCLTLTYVSIAISYFMFVNNQNDIVDKTKKWIRAILNIS
jgi:hypothetical protein